MVVNGEAELEWDRITRCLKLSLWPAAREKGGSKMIHTNTPPPKQGARGIRGADGEKERERQREEGRGKMLVGWWREQECVSG
jgi:hypothetical protein